MRVCMHVWDVWWHAKGQVPFTQKRTEGYEGFSFLSMTKQTWYYSFVNSITIIYNSTEIVHPCRLKRKILFE